MKKLLLTSLLASSLLFAANAQSVFTSTSYSDNFNDNTTANSAEEGWFTSGNYSSISEVGGALNVVAVNADQYFNGFGLYLKPATSIDITANKTVTMTVTNPSATNAIKVRCDVKLVDENFAGPNCPAASGDTINANAGGVTNVITVAAGATTTITFDYSSATAGFEYNSTCGGAWTPVTHTIPAAAWTKMVGLYMVINGGAGESWCGELDGSCTQLSGTVIIEDLVIGGTASSTNAAQSKIASSNVYPNPVSDMATIAMELNAVSDVKVTLSDMMGKEMMTITEGNMSSVNANINVANLNKGIYSVNYMINGAAAKSELLMVK